MTVELFGGAIATSIPPSWRDVSRARQVPDNQEVFQACEEESGAVLVIEILEYQADVANDDACSFFLKDLADANETSMEEQRMHSGQVIDLLRDREGRERTLPKFVLPEHSSNDPPLHACLARGAQKVVRGKGSKGAEWIDVDVCVLRLENVGADLMISLSAPRRGGSIGTSEGLGDAPEDKGQREVFKDVLANFRVCDWGLFG